MTDAKLKELVHMLTVRTAEAKLDWEKAGTESKYGVEFNKGRITVDSWVNKGRRYVNFAVYNQGGYKIEEFKFNDQAEFDWFDLVYKLHQSIEKKCLESTSTVVRILDELKSA